MEIFSGHPLITSEEWRGPLVELNHIMCTRPFIADPRLNGTLSEMCDLMLKSSPLARINPESLYKHPVVCKILNNPSPLLSLPETDLKSLNPKGADTKLLRALPSHIEAALTNLNFNFIFLCDIPKIVYLTTKKVQQLEGTCQDLKGKIQEMESELTNEKEKNEKEMRDMMTLIVGLKEEIDGLKQEKAIEKAVNEKVKIEEEYVDEVKEEKIQVKKEKKDKKDKDKKEKRRENNEQAVRLKVCQKCTKRFRNQKLLNQHMLVHSDVKPFICSTCNFAFTRRQHLMRHNDKLHKYLPFFYFSKLFQIKHISFSSHRL